MLTSTRALRHNSVHFFGISTSNKGPGLVCFVPDFGNVVTPQRHARLRHHNFQKCFENGSVLCTLLLPTTACNFSSLIWPGGPAPAALASLERLTILFAPYFDPPEPQPSGKTQGFATLLPFRAPVPSFFWLFLFSDLHSSAFLLSDSFHLCLSSVRIGGNLTSKLHRW